MSVLEGKWKDTNWTRPTKGAWSKGSRYQGITWWSSYGQKAKVVLDESCVLNALIVDSVTLLDGMELYSDVSVLSCQITRNIEGNPLKLLWLLSKNEIMSKIVTFCENVGK